MGVSTDGILFYGFCIGEDENAEIVIGMDGNGEYLTPELEDDPDNASAGNDRVWAHYFKLDPEDYDAVQEHRDKYPVEIGQHCSYDYPEYFVAIRKSVLSASRGSPEKVKSFEVGKDWDKQLKEFCDLWALEPPNEFGWYLCSMWG